MKGELLTTIQEMLEKMIEGKLLQEIRKEIRNEIVKINKNINDKHREMSET